MCYFCQSKLTTLIAYLEGKLTYKSPTLVHMDVGGIAYEVNISLNTFAALEELDKGKLYTQLIIRENEHSLYGFHTASEKDLFSKLISVKGIGPNTSRVILSYMTPSETKTAILHDNAAAFKKVKGVGPKTAQQIILDLKNKIAKESLEGVPMEKTSVNTTRDEAISALVALGFPRSQVGKMVDKVLSQDNSINQVEVLIKLVLRQIS